MILQCTSGYSKRIVKKNIVLNANNNTKLPDGLPALLINQLL